MAGLKLEVNSNTKDFVALAKAFPDLEAGVMSYIGKQGRLTLKGAFLSGQEINLDAYPEDSVGRYTIGSRVGGKGSSVSITSYTMNLFEKGRLLRSGRREPGKKVITNKLKVVAQANLQGWANEAETKIVDSEINRSQSKAGL